MRSTTIVLVFAFLGTAATAERADGSVEGAIAARYWLAEEGEFDLTLAFDTQVVTRVAVGVRVGMALVTGPNNIGIPLDLTVRFRIEGFYLEGVTGPWVFFEGDHLRAHVAFGFGLSRSRLMFGIDVGYLEPRAIIGLRIGYRF